LVYSVSIDAACAAGAAIRRSDACPFEEDVRGNAPAAGTVAEAPMSGLSRHMA